MIGCLFFSIYIYYKIRREGIVCREREADGGLGIGFDKGFNLSGGVIKRLDL